MFRWSSHSCQLESARVPPLASAQHTAISAASKSLEDVTSHIRFSFCVALECERVLRRTLSISRVSSCLARVNYTLAVAACPLSTAARPPHEWTTSANPPPSLHDLSRSVMPVSTSFPFNNGSANYSINRHHWLAVIFASLRCTPITTGTSLRSGRPPACVPRGCPFVFSLHNFRDGRPPTSALVRRCCSRYECQCVCDSRKVVSFL